MAQEIIKQYTNGDITVVWQPSKCMHSRNCFHGLPSVFDPQARPWVNMQGASTDAIKAQVDACPSGALSYTIGDSAMTDTNTPAAASAPSVQVLPNGPLLVNGKVTVKLADGTEATVERCALCRCGHSANKPYCDGSHSRMGFAG